VCGNLKEKAMPQPQWTGQALTHTFASSPKNLAKVFSHVYDSQRMEIPIFISHFKQQQNSGMLPLELTHLKTVVKSKRKWRK
jgi:hypothetical protein